jgi:hypothetical protein
MQNEMKDSAVTAISKYICGEHLETMQIKNFGWFEVGLQMYNQLSPRGILDIQ